MTRSPDHAPFAHGVVETAERLDRRPWPDFTPIRRTIDVSFEFFPPANPAGAEALQRCLADLAPIGPRFVSVTYGAGGSTQDRTLDTISTILGSSDVAVAGHLTCVGRGRTDVDAVVEAYLERGVRHIVALRGDAPEGSGAGPHPGGYRDAADLVAGIRRIDAEVEVSVAAYPETHPLADSPRSDMDNLKRKLDSGADQAITQFFFDTDVFLRWFDRVRAAGITAPIVPGIMPITDFGRVAGFAQRCGTAVPDELRDLFDGLDDAPEVRDLVAATVTAEQCRRLAEHGIRSFHFYTMNKPHLTAAVCRILGAKPGAGLALQRATDSAAAS